MTAADVAWASSGRVHELGERTCFTQAPEICVEVLSPSNSEAEIEERLTLYLDAVAEEVWICDLSGQMRFRASGNPVPLDASSICPQFPKKVELPGTEGVVGPAF